MSRKPDDLNDQVRNLIDETIRSLVAVGCDHETACGLLIVQSAIRMRDREKVRQMRDFLDCWYVNSVEGDNDGD